MKMNLSSVGVELGNMFKNNRALVHVDLSNNGLSAADCKDMQEGLRLNHTILGLHMGGNNELDVDA